MIKKHWWKALAVLLVCYSLFAGMLIPLRMGITSNKTDLSLKMKAKQQLNVSFYNARFEKENPKKIQARLRIDRDNAICADEIKVISDRVLALTFLVPAIDSGRIKSPFPFLEVAGDINGRTFTDVFILKNGQPEEITTDFCQVTAYPMPQEMTFPFLPILEETIRNLYYHVPMWFGMLLLFLVSTIFSIQQLSGKGQYNDIKAKAFAGVGLLYGLLGLVTGAIWARYTWGAYWSLDVKQNSAAVGILIYLAYFVLRTSFDDADKRARISAVYNIFAFATIIPLLYVIPRMVDSLHPGAEGNPAFSSYDLDSSMRLIFYPSVIGWILLGIWIASIWIRIDKIKIKIIEAV